MLLDVMDTPLSNVDTSHESSEDFADYAMNYAVFLMERIGKDIPESLFETDPNAWDKDSIAGQVVV